MMGCAKSHTESSRLIIRALTLNDQHNYQKLYAHTKVMSSYADGQPRSAARIAKMVQINLERWANHNPFSCMTIELKENKQFIGSIFISTFERYDNTGLLGYLILPEYWACGYATEAVKAVIQDYLPLVNQGQYAEKIAAVYAYTKPNNLASIKILEKTGFTKNNIAHKFGAERLEYILLLQHNF